MDNGEVRALAVYNGELIAAGSFSAIGGQATGNIARWNGTTWQPLGSGTNAIVLALTVFNGELIAGGSFTTAGGVGASRIARWNGASWQSLGTGMNTSVYGLTVFGGQLIASGAFTSAGGSAASYIARWNGSSWLTLGVGTDNAIRAITVHDGALVAGGLFQNAGGAPARCVATWNGASWSTMGSGIQNFSATSDMFVVFSYTSGHLAAGGNFDTAGGNEANRIARWISSRWTSFGGGSVFNVRAFAPFRGRLAAAGEFDQAALGHPAVNVAEWDGTRLYTFGTGMNAVIHALESFKYAGVFGDHELIAGGNFTTAGGLAASRIARWVEDPISAIPPPAWAPMGAGFNNIVFAIRRFGGVTYAAGSFTLSGATGVSRIARWNETTDVWEPLGTGVNGLVRTLEVYGSHLYVGGDFTTAGGLATGPLARWDGAGWSQVGGSLSGRVFALEAHDGELAIGGEFTGIVGSPNLIRWNGASFSTYGTGGTDGEVRAFASAGSRLYAGGDFGVIGGLSAARVAYWDGAWHRAVNGMEDNVFSLIAYIGEVHAGGIFRNVDGSPLLLSPLVGALQPRRSAVDRTPPGGAERESR